MPFLLQAATISVGTPPSDAWNTVGDEPQSGSPRRADLGSTQMSSFASVAASRRTTANMSCWGLPVPEPVVTKMLPLPSAAGDVHTPPPSAGGCTETYECTCSPVSWSYARRPLPGTNGLSHIDE